MASDSNTDMDESPLYTMAQMGDGLPCTSLLWGEKFTSSDDIDEASTSTHHDQNTFDFRDRQHQNLA